MPIPNGFDLIHTDLKCDVRGALAELVRGIPAAQLYIFSILPGRSRGGHWHRRKVEWFCCVAGETLLGLEPDEGRGGRTDILLPGDFSRVVHVHAGTRHTFTSSTGATIVACISESFDPADPDTYFPSST